MQLSQDGMLSQTKIPYKIENLNIETKKAFCLFRAFYVGIYENGEAPAVYEPGFDVLFNILFDLEKGMQCLEDEAFEAMRQEGREYD